MSPDQQIKSAIDGTVGAAGISLPLWIQAIQGPLQIMIAVATLILLGLRIWLAIREARGKVE